MSTEKDLCAECLEEIDESQSRATCQNHPCCKTFTFCSDSCLFSHSQFVEECSNRLTSHKHHAQQSSTAFRRQIQSALLQVGFFKDLCFLVLEYHRTIVMRPFLTKYLYRGFAVDPFFDIVSLSPCCCFWRTNPFSGFRVCNGVILGCERNRGTDDEDRKLRTSKIVDCRRDYRKVRHRNVLHLTWSDSDKPSRISVPGLRLETPREWAWDVDCAFTSYQDELFVLLANGILSLFWMEQLLEARDSKGTVAPFWKQNVQGTSKERIYEIRFDKDNLVMCKSLFSLDVDFRKQVQIWRFL